MRLGIGSYTYGWAVGMEGNRPSAAMTALGLIDRAVSLGVSVVQLCDNLPASEFHPDATTRIAEHAARHGVQIQVGTRGSRPDHLRSLVRIAGGFGSPVLRLVIDEPGDQPSLAEAARRLRAIRNELENCEVTLALENHDRFTASQLADLIQRIESDRVGVCLDTVNSFGALEGPRVVVETLAPHVVNLHLKDFAVIRVPYLQGFVIEGRPLGQGMLDVPWVLERLSHCGRDPDAIIEHWVPPEASVEDTVRKESDWAEQSVRAARKWIAH